MEKLVVMGNFAFSHSAFKRFVLQTCKNKGLFGKGLKPIHCFLQLSMFEKIKDQTTCLLQYKSLTTLQRLSNESPGSKKFENSYLSSCQFAHLRKSHVCERTSCINPFPNKPWFLHVCSTSLVKTLWEMERLLVIAKKNSKICLLCSYAPTCEPQSRTSPDPRGIV